MKAKISRGSGFTGTLNYCLDPDKGAELLDGTTSGQSPHELSQEFGALRRLRPDVEKPVWHCSLSLPKGEKLTDEQWADVTRDFMRGMDFAIDKTAYALVRHQDTEYDHVHVIASRIMTNGKLWFGKKDVHLAIDVCQSLERRHGLTITKGLDRQQGKKALSNGEYQQQERTSILPPREAIRNAIDHALKGTTSVLDFVRQLRDRGITVRPNLATTGRLNGFSFEKDGIPLKGSQLGKEYGFAALQRRGVRYDQERDHPALKHYVETGELPMGGRREYVTVSYAEAAKTSSREKIGTLWDHLLRSRREQKREEFVANGRRFTFPMRRADDSKPAERYGQDRQEFQKQQPMKGIPSHVIAEVKSLSPASYLESRGFQVKREGRHLSVRDGKEEVFRITERPGGFVACDKHGNGIGDNISLVRHIEGVNFREAIERLGGRSFGQEVQPRQSATRITSGQDGRAEQRPRVPPTREIDRMEGKEYLVNRGIDDATIARAEASGFVRHIGGGIVFLGYDDKGVVRSATKRAVDRNAEIQKRDFAGTDKSFAPILPGSEKSIWIVEGGVDALALQSMAARAGKEPPTVIVSGGSNVRGLFDNPKVQGILRQAERVTIACENEKDRATQVKTDNQHQRQADRVKEITGKEAVLNRPPEGIKDLAEMNQRQLAGEKERGQEQQKDQTLSPSASTQERQGERINLADLSGAVPSIKEIRKRQQAQLDARQRPELSVKAREIALGNIREDLAAGKDLRLEDLEKLKFVELARIEQEGVKGLQEIVKDRDMIHKYEVGGYAAGRSFER